MLTQAAPEKPEGWSPLEQKKVPGWTPIDIKQKPILRTDWEKGLLFDELDDIDPEKLISMYEGDGKRSRGSVPDPTEIICETVVQWVTELKTRKEQGHSLYICDDPRRRYMGWVDDTTNEVFLLGLVTFKLEPLESFEEFGFPRNVLSSLQGRKELIGENPDGFSFNDEPDADYQPGVIPELVALWVADVEEEIGEEVRAAEGRRLADVWAQENPWTEEEVRKACGVKPHAEYMVGWEAEMKKLSVEERSRYGAARRRTGRTTEMLIKAVTAALNGEVVLIQGHSPHYSQDLVGQARRMAAICDHTGAKDLYFAWDPRQVVGKLDGKQVTFHDHYLPGGK